MHLLTDKHKSIEELNMSMRTAGIESMQFVLGFDFSGSNGRLHGVDYKNPYMRVIELLQPIAEHFDDDGIINAYRFGCSESCDYRVVPLLGENEEYKGFKQLMDSYIEAARTVSQSGRPPSPTRSRSASSWRRRPAEDN